MNQRIPDGLRACSKPRSAASLLRAPFAGLLSLQNGQIHIETNHPAPCFDFRAGRWIEIQGRVLYELFYVGWVSRLEESTQSGDA